MARYWDVDYEYVGYDKSWDDMQQMLEYGEIDMVTSPRKTPERAVRSSAASFSVSTLSLIAIKRTP